MPTEEIKKSREEGETREEKREKREEKKRGKGEEKRERSKGREKGLLYSRVGQRKGKNSIRCFCAWKIMENKRTDGPNWHLQQWRGLKRRPRASRGLEKGLGKGACACVDRRQGARSHIEGAGAGSDETKVRGR